jgi:hypothetical protein
MLTSGHADIQHRSGRPTKQIPGIRARNSRREPSRRHQSPPKLRPALQPVAKPVSRGSVFDAPSREIDTAHRLTHSTTHRLTHSTTHRLTHSTTHRLTHSTAHRLATAPRSPQRRTHNAAHRLATTPHTASPTTPRTASPAAASGLSSANRLWRSRHLAPAPRPGTSPRHLAACGSVGAGCCRCCAGAVGVVQGLHKVGIGGCYELLFVGFWGSLAAGWWLVGGWNAVLGPDCWDEVRNVGQYPGCGWDAWVTGWELGGGRLAGRGAAAAGRSRRVQLGSGLRRLGCCRSAGGRGAVGNRVTVRRSARLPKFGLWTTCATPRW